MLTIPFCRQHLLDCGFSADTFCERQRYRLKTRSRGDVDDTLLPSLQHSRKEAVGELNDGLVVETEHLKLSGKGQITEFSAKTEAGVVDKQLDRNAAAGELFGEDLACSRGR